MAKNIDKIRTSNFWANLFKPPTQKNDLEEVLKNMPPFKHLKHKELKLLMQLIHHRAYTANEYVFYQGDPGIALYIIQKGEVLVTLNSEGNNQNLAIFGRGDFFGEMALLDEEIRSASAIALSDADLAVIFKPDLDEFIDKYPDAGIKITRGLLQIIVTRLRVINHDYITLRNKSLEHQKEELK